MPIRGEIFAVIVDVGLFFRGCECGGFGGIDAYENDIELIAGFPFHRAKTIGCAVKDEGAEHRAFVISQDEDGGFCAEIIADVDGFAGFVGES
jgi:hypothetical protein